MPSLPQLPYYYSSQDAIMKELVTIYPNVWKSLQRISASSDYQSFVITQQQLIFVGIISLFLLKTSTKAKVKVVYMNFQASMGLILPLLS